MANSADEDDDFHVVTDKDFAKYPLQNPQNPWKPLTGPRHIRLLKIFSKLRPGTTEEETIECRLEEWDLDKAKDKYEALSYAWGQPKNGFAFIQCNNVTMKIWRNLYQALLRVREKIGGGKTRGTRLLWIDALCIDQNDTPERQKQILLMKNIFGYASQVLIWLGEHDKASLQVWKSSEGVRPGSSREAFRNVFQWNVKMQDSFLRRLWFSRVWTLQEVVLSSKATLLCGEDEMDWTTFCTIWKDRYEFMKNLKPEIRESRIDHIEESLAFIGLMNCFDIQQVRNSTKTELAKILPLSEILIRTWYRDATDPHDRIYALLGLVQITDYAGLETPDYSRSLLELFVHVIKTAMLVDKTPSLLNIAGLSPEDMSSQETLPSTNIAAEHPEPSVTDLVRRPSWVPDWTKHGWENTWLTARLKSDDSNARINPGLDNRYYYGSKTWSPIFENNKLHIRGYFVGYFPQTYITLQALSNNHRPTTFRVKGLSPWSTGALRWVGKSLENGKEYDIPPSGLPYGGETAREGDVVCVFEGLRSLFLVRMLFSFEFGVWGALEWLKEDMQYKGLKLNCLLVGAMHVDGVELAENPSLGDGDWNFIIN